jgi:hypothetical protein
MVPWSYMTTFSQSNASITHQMAVTIEGEDEKATI